MYQNYQIDENKVVPRWTRHIRATIEKEMLDKFLIPEFLKPSDRYIFRNMTVSTFKKSKFPPQDDPTWKIHNEYCYESPREF